jgi:hypothetical protein
MSALPLARNIITAFDSLQYPEQPSSTKPTSQEIVRARKQIRTLPSELQAKIYAFSNTLEAWCLTTGIFTQPSKDLAVQIAIEKSGRERLKNLGIQPSSSQSASHQLLQHVFDRVYNEAPLDTKRRIAHILSGSPVPASIALTLRKVAVAAIWFLTNPAIKLVFAIFQIYVSVKVWRFARGLLAKIQEDVSKTYIPRVINLAINSLSLPAIRTLDKILVPVLWIFKNQWKLSWYAFFANLATNKIPFLGRSVRWIGNILTFPTLASKKIANLPFDLAYQTFFFNLTQFAETLERAPLDDALYLTGKMEAARVLWNDTLTAMLDLGPQLNLVKCKLLLKENKLPECEQLLHSINSSAYHSNKEQLLLQLIERELDPNRSYELASRLSSLRYLLAAVKMIKTKYPTDTYVRMMNLWQRENPLEGLKRIEAGCAIVECLAEEDRQRFLESLKLDTLLDLIKGKDDKTVLLEDLPRLTKIPKIAPNSRLLLSLNERITNFIGVPPSGLTHEEKVRAHLNIARFRQDPAIVETLIKALPETTPEEIKLKADLYIELLPLYDPQNEQVADALWNLTLLYHKYPSGFDRQGLGSKIITFCNTLDAAPLWLSEFVSAYLGNFSKIPETTPFVQILHLLECLETAPSEFQQQGLLWAEIRLLELNSPTERQQVMLKMAEISASDRYLQMYEKEESKNPPTKTWRMTAIATAALLAALCFSFRIYMRGRKI